MKSVRQAIELILDSRRHRHIATYQITVPADADPNGSHAGGAAHRDSVTAADRVHDFVANHTTAVLEATTLCHGGVAG